MLAHIIVCFAITAAWVLWRPATGRVIWQKLSPRIRRQSIGALAGAYALAMRLWLSVLAFATVRLDPFGRSRAPLPVTIGRAGTPGKVVFTAGTTPLERRVAVFYWRNSREFTRAGLCQLAAKYGIARAFVLSGVVVLDRRGGAPSPPLGFILELDLETGTATLTHTRAWAASDESFVCKHAPAAFSLGSVALRDVLAPLLKRRQCPSLAKPAKSSRH